MDDLRAAVHSAAGRNDVRQAVDQVYAELQQQVDARRPLCVISGRCCRFEEYGHRLYVTTLELARFVMDLSSPALLLSDGGGCRFQVGTLCSVHAIRPFGCRIFFCDASSTDWQHQLYERLHGRLRMLHDQLGVPYHYVEWRYGLSQALPLSSTAPAIVGQPLDSRANGSETPR